MLGRLIGGGILNTSVKKIWLLSSIVYLASMLIDAFKGDPYMPFEFQLLFVNLVVPFGYLIIETLNFIALYLFSYVKNGTILLTLNMGLSLARIGVWTFPFWFWKNTLAFYENTPDRSLLIDILVTCVYLLIIIQWFVISLKLRRENKIIKMNEMLSHPESQRLIQELKAATNLDELSVKYGESCRALPQIAKALAIIYHQRQAELSG